MREIVKESKHNQTVWNIFFTFEKSKAEVEISYTKGELDLHVYSKTDGFHWFEFFMSQKPNCQFLEFDTDNPEDSMLAKREVKNLFFKNGFIYKPEDKESCYLNSFQPYTDDHIETIANLIEERFANRERFF